MTPSYGSRKTVKNRRIKGECTDIITYLTHAGLRRARLPRRQHPLDLRGHYPKVLLLDAIPVCPLAYLVHNTQQVLEIIGDTVSW